MPSVPFLTRFGKSHPAARRGLAMPAANLTDALQQYQLDVPAEAVPRLEQYCRLLWESNRHLNLTRHTDFDKFAARDMVDVLQLAPLLAAGEEVLDVGSGGGVPGVVLAILRPDLKVSLCESVVKKAAALERIVSVLELPLPVHACRAEALLAERRFDVLVARAVGPLWKMLKWFQPHWESIGRLLAIKGPRWVAERGEARHRGVLRGLELRRVVSYHMPGSGAESVILQIWPKSPRQPPGEP